MTRHLEMMMSRSKKQVDGIEAKVEVCGVWCWFDAKLRLSCGEPWLKRREKIPALYLRDSRNTASHLSVFWAFSLLIEFDVCLLRGANKLYWWIIISRVHSKVDLL